MWEIRKSLPLPTVRGVKFIEVQREYREEREYKVYVKSLRSQIESLDGYIFTIISIHLNTMNPM